MPPPSSPPRRRAWLRRAGRFLTAAALALAVSAPAQTEPPAAANPVAAAPAVPLQPSWQQLVNGSPDGKLIELRGIVESLTPRPNGWTRVLLRLPDGVIKVDVFRATTNPPELEPFANAAVRLRGEMRIDRGPDGRIKAGQLRLLAAEVVADETGPEALAALPVRPTASLLRVGPSIDPLQRVKVAGVIVHVRGEVYFAMDGDNGLRFVTNQPLAVKVGDRVEVAGFPQISAAAPVLRGAVVRKIGEAALAAPRAITAEDLPRPALDALRVRVEGELIRVRRNAADTMLELQAGPWRYLARLDVHAGDLAGLQPGSRLELTGVYCAQGEYKALGEDIAAMDLLLGSPADVRVLETPSWWTLPRLLVVTALLLCLLLAVMLWNTQLRRQVEQRSAELQAQIQARQRIEQQRAMEQERARIAQDLHDELGSGVTAIGMLAARAQAVSATEGNRREHLGQIGEQTRAMVTALDEIVWATNPAHDSLASLVTYFSLYADRFLALAGVRWTLDDRVGPAADHALDSRCRHQLFLVLKEALTNVVRHAAAKEVRVAVRREQAELVFTVADDGRGFAPAAEPAREAHGLANMRGRVEKLGGRFEVASAAGAGTTLTFRVPAGNTP